MADNLPPRGDYRCIVDAYVSCDGCEHREDGGTELSPSGGVEAGVEGVPQHGTSSFRLGCRVEDVPGHLHLFVLSVIPFCLTENQGEIPSADTILISKTTKPLENL